ncbi:RNA methyltransferase [Fodinicurvata halophila]|uniref:RNA methyltransferase n=1 Tax=Fodinicurvata halophila TaxID=1419723 RepID=A0ABV8UIW5_9PROT
METFQDESDPAAVTLRQADAPAVILVAPQLGENIGMTARAMLNCGLTDLRLVQPRDGWPNRDAVTAASGATEVLDRTRVYDSTRDAVADLHRLYVTTGRNRELVKPVLTARAAAAEVHDHASVGHRSGVLFGPERTGLENDDLALGDAIIRVPLNPAYKSLNLAQAVLIFAYEWFQYGSDDEPRQLPMGNSRPAERGKVVEFFERLENLLEVKGYFHPPEKRPAMVRNLRSFFLRAEPTDQEIRTLHGVVSALLGAKMKRARSPAQSEDGDRDE